jgi:uncharacterized protein YgiM (DUF1202 family)
MKKSALIFIQLMVALTVYVQTYKYTSTNLNSRSEPSTSYQLLPTNPTRTSIEMAENFDSAGIKVYYNGKIGYVSSKHLTGTQAVNYQNKNTTTLQRNTNSTLKYYPNSGGQKVQSPTHYNSVPADATALCRDGTYSFSQNRRGTCSHHGGVEKWLRLK